MPNTIEQNLQRLVNAKSAISEAITAKGGTVSTGDGFEEFPADIATIPGGGGGSGDASKPVRFMDYDGSIVASYTPEEFAELTEMPANPSHDGLTAQGWNWSITDAKAYVAEYGLIDIGQMYITDDGRTRLYVRMQEGRLSPVLKLYLNANSELDIDWGDNTSHSTFTSTSANYKSERHAYASKGDYIISIGVTRGSFSLQSSSTVVSTLFTNGNNSSSSPDRGYLNTIRKIEIGDNVTSIGENTFYYCTSLSQVTIPNGITSIGENAFYYCNSLSQVTIPNGITSIGENAFYYCNSLSQVTIPNSITSIGAGAFSGCFSLSQVTIPNSITSIGAGAFYYCRSLSQVTIPNGITSIGAGAFSGCFSLSQVTIPNGITSIGEGAFSGCNSLGCVKFVSQTPPTVSNSSAWSGVPTDCKILVPRGTLSAYTSATNYPSSSTYTYEEYD